MNSIIDACALIFLALVVGFLLYLSVPVLPIPIHIDDQQLSAACSEWSAALGYKIVCPPASMRWCPLGTAGCWHNGAITLTIWADKFGCAKRIVLLHEIGHGLGLAHSRQGIMYGICSQDDPSHLLVDFKTGPRLPEAISP